jgi:hypothetical protein
MNTILPEASDDTSDQVSTTAGEVHWAELSADERDDHLGGWHDLDGNL